MHCSKCNHDFKNCSCEDLEKRLDSIPSLIYKKCTKCGKHYTRCKCEDPNWIRSRGGHND